MPSLEFWTCYRAVASTPCSISTLWHKEGLLWSGIFTGSTKSLSKWEWRGVIGATTYLVGPFSPDNFIFNSDVEATSMRPRSAEGRLLSKKSWFNCEKKNWERNKTNCYAKFCMFQLRPTWNSNDISSLQGQAGQAAGSSWSSLVQTKPISQQWTLKGHTGHMLQTESCDSPAQTEAHWALLQTRLTGFNKLSLDVGGHLPNRLNDNIYYDEYQYVEVPTNTYYLDHGSRWDIREWFIDKAPGSPYSILMFLNRSGRDGLDRYASVIHYIPTTFFGVGWFIDQKVNKAYSEFASPFYFTSMIWL